MRCDAAPPRAASPPVVHFNCLQWWTAIEANSYTLFLALCEVNAIWSWSPSSWHLAPFHGSVPRRVMIRLRLASPCPSSIPIFPFQGVLSRLGCVPFLSGCSSERIILLVGALENFLLPSASHHRCWPLFTGAHWVPDWAASLPSLAPTR